MKTAFLVLMCSMGLAACSSGGSASNASTVNSSSAVTILPSSVTLAFGQQYTFAAMGGAGYGYTFQIVNAPNSSAQGTLVSSTGFYTAPSANQTLSIMVTDVNGASATATVTISSTATSTTTTNAETPLWRFFNTTTGEHFYSGDSTEGAKAGDVPEGIAFLVLQSQQVGSVALYRCNTGSSHFMSLDQNCEGFTNESTYGFIYTAQQSNTVPVYRFFSPTSGDHLVTTNYSEGAGYQYESTLGYVFTN